MATVAGSAQGTQAQPYRPFPAAGPGEGGGPEASPQLLPRVSVSHRQGLPPPGRAELLLRRNFLGLPQDPCLMKNFPLSTAERVLGAMDADQPDPTTRPWPHMAEADHCHSPHAFDLLARAAPSAPTGDFAGVCRF